MKRIWAFFVLAFAVAPAIAGGPCKRWIDAEGFERVRCDPNAPVAIPLTGVAEKTKYTREDIRVYSPDTHQFSVYDRETKVIKHCRKNNGWVDCL